MFQLQQDILMSQHRQSMEIRSNINNDVHCITSPTKLYYSISHVLFLPGYKKASVCSMGTLAALKYRPRHSAPVQKTEIPSVNFTRTLTNVESRPMVRQCINYNICKL